MYSTIHFSKDFREKNCTRENNIHGKTTFTSFLLRSSQIIGNDEESIENSEYAGGKFKQHSKSHKAHVFENLAHKSP